VGRKQFIIEVKTPELARGEKQPHPANLRLERAIEVIDAKVIKVLYVEGQPRYEYRYIKALLSVKARRQEEQDHRAEDLPRGCRSGFRPDRQDGPVEFPRTRRSLPIRRGHPGDVRCGQAGNANLQHLPTCSRRDAKGKKLAKGGGGLLLMPAPCTTRIPIRDAAGAVIPIEPGANRRSRSARKKGAPGIDADGPHAPDFPLQLDDPQNMAIMQRFAPMYCGRAAIASSRSPKCSPSIPISKAIRATRPVRRPAAAVVQQFVGSGRSIFFGFDETWRWRFREMKFTSTTSGTRPCATWPAPGRPAPTCASTAKRVPPGRADQDHGTLPDSTPIPGITTPRLPRRSKSGRGISSSIQTRRASEPEVTTIQLGKLEGSWGTFEHTLNRRAKASTAFA